MNHVIRHIEYLVYRHDCVVLPKWGAFIADYQSACYDEALGVMYPPMRELSFSASVDYNDGLLASSIARKESISFAQASRIVEDELSSMKHQLNLDGEISLGKIGRFIRQGDGLSVLFEPAKRQLNVGSVGFEALAIKPLLEKVKEEAIKVGRIEAPRRSRLSRFGLRFIEAAAVIAVIIGVALVLLRPSFERNDNMASLSPVMSPKSSQTSVVPSLDEPPMLNISVPRENIVEDEVEAPQAEEISKVEIATESNSVDTLEDSHVATIRMNASDRYCLVIASLPTMELAEKYIGENNNYNLGVLAKDGKFRVYVATGNTTTETLDGKNFADIATRFADAWVCSMR